MPSASRILTALGGVGLCALAALVTHQIAYLLVMGLGIVAPSDMTDHGHLTAQWAIVSPVAILAASGFVVRQVHRLGAVTPLSVVPSALITGLLFCTQELIEGLVAGRGAVGTATSPAVIAGVLLAPIVAFALVRLLDGVTELVRRFVQRSDSPPRGSRPVRPGSRVVPIPVRVVANTPTRGPPVRRSFRR